MAETETGWTRGFPVLDGDYYSRVDEFDKQPTAIQIESRTSDTPAAVYEFGCDKDLRREYEAEDYEYLGPISPEQLTRLREAARDALKWFEIRDMGRQAPFIVAALREALAQGHTGGEQS